MPSSCFITTSKRRLENGEHRRVQVNVRESRLRSVRSPTVLPDSPVHLMPAEDLEILDTE